MAARYVQEERVAAELGEVRERTLALVAHLPARDLERVLDPIMSPLVWDLAHIAAYEDLWLAHRLGGVDARPGLVTPLMNRMAGLFNADVREGNELMDHWTKPFVVDDSAFRAAFPGHTATPLADAITASLAGWRAHGSASAA